MTKAVLIGTLLALSAGDAQADVTARQVWDDWVATIEESEATLSTDSVVEEDAGLQISGLSVTSDRPDGSYELRIDEVVLAETAEGTVRVTTSPSYPITLRGEDQEGRPLALTLRVRQPDLVMTVSGDGRPRQHAYEAPEIEVELVEAMRDGAPMDLDLSARLSDVSGTYTVAETAAESLGSDFSAAEASLSASGADPDGGGRFDVSAEVADIEADGVSSFLGIGDMAAAVGDGLESAGSISYGPSSYTITGTGEDGAFTLEGGAESGALMAELSAEGLVYGGRNRDARLSLSGDQIPLPQITIETAETSGQLTMPLLAEAAPQRFGLTLRLVDATVSEEVWSAFDPAGVLPRDPATLVLDLSGTATLSQDLLSAPAEGATPLGEVETVAIDEMRLSAAGAELTGTGALELVEDAAAGAPQPVGEVTLRLVGGNALLDRLEQIGLIPEDQAMGARLMLGLFAQQGEGEDVLTSTIEFTEEGEILANGQRIR